MRYTRWTLAVTPSERARPGWVHFRGHQGQRSPGGELTQQKLLSDTASMAKGLSVH